VSFPVRRMLSYGASGAEPVSVRGGCNGVSERMSVRPGMGATHSLAEALW